jgi:hypothetical protein
MIRLISSEEDEVSMTLSPLMEMEKYFKEILFKKPARRDGCEHSNELLICFKVGNLHAD